MFQTPQSKIGNVMQTATHLTAPQNTSVLDTPDGDILSTNTCESTHDMRSDVQCLGSSSGTTTPVSTRSSISYETNASSISSSSRPKRSSMKSSLKAVPTEVRDMNTRSSRAAVRFADPEPASRPRPTPVQQQQSSRSQLNGVPNPLLRYQHRPASSMSSSASSRCSVGPQAYSTLPPRGVPTPLPGHIQNTRTRVGLRYSAPVQPSRPQPRWSGVPLPANFTPPSVALEHRVSSFQSVASISSVQSAPAALQHPPTGTAGQYKPLEHYVPCLHIGCTVHYSHSFAYYLPQGPYSLSKLHGYCNHHATKELKESNAICKQKWESLRQNAGRKTLGQIATDFDDFLDSFKQDRQTQDTQILGRQKRIVLGAPNPIASVSTKATKPQPADTEWNWIYTPRNCTRSSCPSSPYSPFSNHLFAFYHTPRASTFTPLSTLCPSCAKTEVEAFERMVGEKWSSRCGWDEGEWVGWLGKVVTERREGGQFWERAQERVVRERGVGRWVEKEGQGGISGDEVGKGEGRRAEGKKKGVLKRLFGG